MHTHIAHSNYARRAFIALLTLAAPLAASACSAPAPTSQGRQVAVSSAALGIAPCEANSDPDYLTPPEVPAALAAPETEQLTDRLCARGFQVYTCKATASGAATTFAWTLKAPDAILYDQDGDPAGTHFGGPTWKSSVDGSTVVGKVAAMAASPEAGAVPWLLLEAKANTGDGDFSTVRHIQRVDTIGGKAPATGCSARTVGAELRVEYGASYFFYSN